MMQGLILAAIMMVPSVKPGVIEQAGSPLEKPRYVSVYGADAFHKDCKFILNEKEVDFNILTEMPPELVVIQGVKVEKRLVMQVKARYSTKAERNGP